MKKIFTLRLMLISLFAAMSMATNARIIDYNTDDGFKYKLNTEEKTAHLSSYSGAANEVYIPDSITYSEETFSITSIGAYCFYNCTSLMSINIPSSVTSLGDLCFYNCASLTSINIPSSVTSLGNYCFYQCTSLTSINIPSSVTSLGYSCFYGCTSLTSIDIPSSVTELESECFSGCSSLTSIDIPSSITYLGHSCFEGCTSLTSIDIPSSVTWLGNHCFNGCTSLTSIVIPSSVQSLGSECFRDCTSLKTMICKISSAILGTEYDSDFFEDTPIEQATLYVPETSLESYKTTSPWSGFGKILPISPDGIKKTTTDKEATIDAIYNLEGKRRNGIRSGINIIRMSDGTTKKVLK